MKTIDFLRLLSSELDGFKLREAALKNYNPKFCNPNVKPIDFEYALCCAFKFSDTPEGKDFWYEMARKLRGVVPDSNQIKLEL